MFSTVRGIVSRPIVPPPARRSESIAARTTALPRPRPCSSGRTAIGPIHPSLPDRCARLKAATRPSRSRQTIAPSPASAMAKRQMAGSRWGTRTPGRPSRRYRSVNASLKTWLSEGRSASTGRTGPVSSASGCHILCPPGIVLHPCGARRPVELDPEHPVEAVADRLDVGDEDDLRESVGERAQEVEHGLAPVLVQRPEDLVEHEQRERLAGPLGDHLADGEPERQV